ncbi:MAG: hypothetical protein LBB83_07925, partial [Treponema sp.]|nr:hypothetical protein [Treponema sp.]
MKLTAGLIFHTVFLLMFLTFSGCAGLRSGGAGPVQAGADAEGEGAPEPEDEDAPVQTDGEDSARESDTDAEPDTAGPGAAAAGGGTGAGQGAAGAEPAAGAGGGTDPAGEGTDAENGGAASAEEPEDEAAGESEGEESGEEEGPTQEQKILELDIKTSSLGELAAWCRSLGLSEGGSKEQMADRLRAYYELPPPSGAKQQEEGGNSKKKTIIIESARSTEYFTLDAVDEEYARLTGDVVISLKDGDANYRIQAEEILFNRTRNIISASGGVEFLKEDGNTKETFRGERITVDLDNWASVFMDSVSERSMSGDENVFRFSGSLITRSDEKATILTDATITNGESEETFWSIDASRLWLLPGNDWAFLNAVLK